MKKTLVSFFAIVLAFTSISPSAQAKDANPYGSSFVDPAGVNEVIFTVSKGMQKIQFTTSKLYKLKSKEINIYEPFLKKRQNFTVIPLKTFFKLVGISNNDKVTTKALNDYVYKNTAAKFIAANAFLAIKREGEGIPYDQGGPVRIVYEDTSVWAKNLDAWNWSLSSLTGK